MANKKVYSGRVREKYKGDKTENRKKHNIKVKKKNK